MSVRFFASSKLRPLAYLASFAALLTAFGPTTHAAEDSPLRDHLKARKHAILELQKRDAAPTHLHVKVTAVSRSGVRRLRIGDKGQFEWLSDSPRSGAGFDLGPGFMGIAGRHARQRGG
jgi:hypothetical protein